MFGLLVRIIGDDSTNNGVTSGKHHAILKVDGVTIFEANKDHPSLIVIEGPYDKDRLQVGKPVVKRDGSIVRARAVPCDQYGKPITRRMGMFGGNYITTSDSRFPYHSPIPVHDRFE